MSVQQTAVVFPYSDIHPRTAEALCRLTGPLHLYQPVAMEPSNALAGLTESGMVTLEQPDQDRLDSGQVKAAVAEFRGWINSTKDPSELAHLRGATLGKDAPATSGVMSAIRTFGRGETKSPLPDHLLLHIAAQYDAARSEMQATVDKVRGFEAGLGRAMGLKKEEFEDEPEELGQALDPLSVPDIGLDPLIGLRLKAWAALYRSKPVEAKLWVTGPAVIRHLTNLMSEAGQGEPAPTAELPLAGLDKSAWEKALAAVSAEGAAEPAPAEAKSGAALRLWSFPSVLLANVLGLNQQGVSGTVVEITPWR